MRYTAVSLFLFAIPASPGFGQESYFRITKENFECIVRHRQVYEAFETNPIYVIVDECQPDGPSEPASLLDAIRNEAPDLEISEYARKLDGFLALSPDVFACLARLDVPDGEVFQVFTSASECKIEIE